MVPERQAGGGCQRSRRVRGQRARQLAQHELRRSLSSCAWPSADHSGRLRAFQRRRAPLRRSLAIMRDDPDVRAGAMFERGDQFALAQRQEAQHGVVHADLAPTRAACPPRACRAFPRLASQPRGRPISMPVPGPALNRSTAAPAMAPAAAPMPRPMSLSACGWNRSMSSARPAAAAHRRRYRKAGSYSASSAVTQAFARANARFGRGQRRRHWGWTGAAPRRSAGRPAARRRRRGAPGAAARARRTGASARRRGGPAARRVGRVPLAIQRGRHRVEFHHACSPGPAPRAVEWRDAAAR